MYEITIENHTLQVPDWAKAITQDQDLEWWICDQTNIIPGEGCWELSSKTIRPKWQKVAKFKSNYNWTENYYLLRTEPNYILKDLREPTELQPYGLLEFQKERLQTQLSKQLMDAAHEIQFDGTITLDLFGVEIRLCLQPNSELDIDYPALWISE